MNTKELGNVWSLKYGAGVGMGTVTKGRRWGQRDGDGNGDRGSRMGMGTVLELWGRSVDRDKIFYSVILQFKGKGIIYLFILFIYFSNRVNTVAHA